MTRLTRCMRVIRTWRLEVNERVVHIVNKVLHVYFIFLMFDCSRLIVNIQFVGYCTILSDYLGDLGVNALQLSVEALLRTMTKPQLTVTKTETRKCWITETVIETGKIKTV